MNRFSLASVCVGSLVLGACDKKAPAPPLAMASSSVETVPVVSRTLDTVDRLPAQLLPYEMVDVYPKVTGFLEEIRVDVGSQVKQGDFLMRLSAPELLARKAQAHAALQSAESQLTTVRAKLAADEGTYKHLAQAAQTPGVVAANDLAIAQQTVEADRGSVGAAEHNVRAARDTLREVAQIEAYLTIYAPFNATVTRRNLHPGALVGPAAGQPSAIPIIQLVDVDRLRLVVPVPEADVGAIRDGQEVAFSVPAYLGEIFRAPIARVSHDIDLKTRTMHIELDVPNTDKRLSPGAFATVSWPVTRDRPTLFVPTSAMASDQQRTFVIRIANGVAEWMVVQTGHSANGEIEVVGDLRPGDAVVRNATDSIRNGEKVNKHPSADASPTNGEHR
ncbi:putative Co/Zn/Cd efflux system membrane fusion protein [Labilithrix luteola]|uniref:Putative Co/Zn/Cd efflux system membrane fusion protein n=1 Tax=Labilithrix luteola TaxID=1391654 RepID=A0A0K1Q3D2_9BACT|nr:efflux RND transporter periplasmic adaptor subunit [Labilithrix luteola]AKV00274.1 putative Co/Zn/Cd efflux system membrane fusion protein [Labilithrix luteola]